MRNKTHLKYLIGFVLLFLLSACTDGVINGALTVRGPAYLKVTDVKRQSYKGVLLGITEEEWEASGQAGDYLKITFQLENPENGRQMHFMGNMLALSWGDNYARVEIGTGPIMLKPEPGEVEEFTCVFKLADRGKVSSVQGPDDLHLIYDEDLIAQGTGEGMLKRILKNANLSVPLSKLWSGSFE